MSGALNYRIPLYRVALVRDSSESILKRKPAQNSIMVVELVRAVLGDTDREHFLVVMIDGKNRPIGVNVVSTGSLTASLVHPRETFKPAILSNAAAVILAHNHPSGEATPSAEDEEITRRLVDAGAILGIRVLDHIIVGEPGSYYSFLDRGVLPTARQS